MSRQPLPLLAQVAIAVSAVLVATLVRLLFSPILGSQSPFATYFVAILITACFWGWGPGLLTLVLGTVPGTYLFVPEVLEHGWPSLEGLIRLGAFLAGRRGGHRGQRGPRPGSAAVGGGDPRAPERPSENSASPRNGTASRWPAWATR